MEKQLEEAVTHALLLESYDPKDLEKALSMKHSKLSAVNTLFFQGLEREFGHGKLLGLNFAVSSARSLLSFAKKIRGRA